MAGAHWALIRTGEWAAKGFTYFCVSIILEFTTIRICVSISFPVHSEIFVTILRVPTRTGIMGRHFPFSNVNRQEEEVKSHKNTGKSGNSRKNVIFILVIFK